MFQQMKTIIKELVTEAYRLDMTVKQDYIAGEGHACRCLYAGLSGRSEGKEDEGVSPSSVGLLPLLHPFVS